MSHRLAIICTLALAHRADAAECPATVVLAGDGALVDSIDAALVSRGVATSAVENCPAAKAHVEHRGTGVMVVVTDPNGRRSERTLGDVAAAASLIESWARQDMNAAALLGWVEPTPVASEPRIDVVSAPAVSQARVRDPFTLVAAAEASVGFDGSSWFGGRASACVRVGPLCAGASGRVLSGDPRRSYDVLAAADLPIALGRRVVVVTGAGIGMGWFEAQTTMGEATSTVTTTGVRIDGHVSLSVSLARYASLHAGVSVGASPQAPVTIATGDVPLTNGEPAGFLRGDIGLRIGAP